MKIYNWGIIGPGKIARKFADDLQRLPNARIHAVASTSPERARAFANEYGVAHVFSRYEDIIHCSDLDVVYIATPHVLHCENALMCIEHGIPVLCEKPFAMNSSEARRMVSAARRNRVFLMEALWTRFIPAVDHAFELVAGGEIGDLHTVKSDFGFYMPFEANHRIFNKALGGGSLLDIGIYPALLALFLFGKPDRKHRRGRYVYPHRCRRVLRFQFSVCRQPPRHLPQYDRSQYTRRSLSLRFGRRDPPAFALAPYQKTDRVNL